MSVSREMGPMLQALVVCGRLHIEQYAGSNCQVECGQQSVRTDMNDRIRVLLADDHEVVRQGVRRFLDEAGDIEVVAEAESDDVYESLMSDHLT